MRDAASAHFLLWRMSMTLVIGIAIGVVFNEAIRAGVKRIKAALERKGV